jgi:hypothetical protein
MTLLLMMMMTCDDIAALSNKPRTHLQEMVFSLSLFFLKYDNIK